MKKTLHVVFKTHLDIGFTDLATEVVDQYLFDYIPKALTLGEQVPDKFIWTTGAWLIDLYLRDERVCEQDRKRMLQAIENGTIRWHGLPFTIHTELMDEDLTEYAISISKKLDQHFNKQTIAAKMTDIPGHTLALVPPLAKAGIRYLHIGVNASSAIPEVPELFNWRAPDGSSILVHYAKDYGDVFEKPTWPHALYFAHSHDNMGPPASVKEVTALFEKLNQEYPDYEIIPSTLDNFATAILPYRETLPVIEEEIGDSWIHGIASDPQKIANYRTLLALKSQWLADGQLLKNSQAYQDFMMQLLLIPEHTWGANANVYLPDYRHFLLSEFQDAKKADLITFNHDRSTMDYGDLMAIVSTDIDWQEKADQRRYSRYEQSWQEQNNYLKQAIQYLPTNLQEQAQQALSKNNTKLPDINTQQPAMLPGKTYTFGNIQIVFDVHGAISQLQIQGRDLLDDNLVFGGLSYERFDFANYAAFFKQYSRLTRWTTGWAMGDFGRRGIEAYPSIRYEFIQPTIKGSAITQESDRITIRIDVTYTDEQISNWGLPRNNQLKYQIDLKKQCLTLDYAWQNKAENPMPEAYWLETSLKTATPTRWRMHKIGTTLPIDEVVVNGNRKMHALSTKGISYQAHDGQYQIQSYQAPLFSFGCRSLLNFDNQLPQINQGIFVNLHNNVWGTNFKAWCGDDMHYQVTLKWANQFE